MMPVKAVWDLIPEEVQTQLIGCIVIAIGILHVQLRMHLKHLTTRRDKQYESLRREIIATCKKRDCPLVHLGTRKSDNGTKRTKRVPKVQTTSEGKPRVQSTKAVSPRRNSTPAKLPTADTPKTRVKSRTKPQE